MRRNVRRHEDDLRSARARRARRPPGPCARRCTGSKVPPRMPRRRAGHHAVMRLTAREADKPRHIASSRSGMPAPLTPETRRKGSESCAARSRERVDGVLVRPRRARRSCSRRRSAAWRPASAGTARSSCARCRDPSTGSRPLAPETSDEVHEHLGPLEVAQELMAEALPAVRAFDQARARRRRRSCDRRRAARRRGSASAW